MDTHLEAATDTEAFRRVLGHFCTGIVVVAALGPDGPHGLTCQSFASLSLAPPLVLFSPARTSTSWPRIREIGSFCISVLAEGDQQLSTQMARSGTDKFAGVEWNTTPLGAPRLSGAVAWLDCTLHAEYDGGDHTIAVAAVHHLAAQPRLRPLLYYQGRYAALNSLHHADDSPHFSTIDSTSGSRHR
ncbi:flavin reductase family protein [Streptomyces sp. NPDC048564]|uniref:flavin reductase family protein n=1 Tax=unclassified Streptomyces TaxID=2593676 RepID=UPI00344479EB